MKIIFWFSLAGVMYAYVGYLAILTIITMFRKKTFIEDGDYTPSVSLIIAAHNEEKVIKQKIEESLALDYPKEDLEIIVASDASTDRTDDIVKRFRDGRVVLVRQNVWAGKTAAQNLAASRSGSKILVFSDATTVFEKKALRKLAKHFSDPRVGCVGGEEHFIKSEKGISAEAGFFWKYEKLIRRKESCLNTMIGVSGCIFAIRRELYESLEESLIEDFALPLKVASKGYNVIYEKEAIGYEHAVANTEDELARKTRIVAGGINVLARMGYLLNPFKYPSISFQLISHKIFRWLAPIFMAMLFVSNLFLLNDGTGYLVFGILQIAFYSLAIAGYLFRDHYRAPRAIRLAYHFLIVNLAAIGGIFRFFSEDKRPIWDPVR